MIGTSGAFSRIAFDTAIAERNCGPPMTVMPTAATGPSPTVRTTVETKSRSILPSMIVDWYLPSSAADKLIIASGKRACFVFVIVGLMSRIRCKSVMQITPQYAIDARTSCLALRHRGREPEYGQPLIHETAFGQHRNLQTPSAKFFQEEAPVPPECRQQHQCKSSRI